MTYDPRRLSQERLCPFYFRHCGVCLCNVVIGAAVKAAHNECRVALTIRRMWNLKRALAWSGAYLPLTRLAFASFPPVVERQGVSVWWLVALITEVPRAALEGGDVAAPVALNHRLRKTVCRAFVR